MKGTRTVLRLYLRFLRKGESGWFSRVFIKREVGV